jgi:hypothetical protein
MKVLEELAADLLALPSDSRAFLARALIESLEETSDENAEVLWADEIRRRDADLRSGKVATKPSSKVLQDAHKRLTGSKG